MLCAEDEKVAGGGGGGGGGPDVCLRLSDLKRFACTSCLMFG